MPGCMSEGGSSSKRRKPGKMWLKFFFCITRCCEWPSATKFQKQVILDSTLKNFWCSSRKRVTNCWPTCSTVPRWNKTKLNTFVPLQMSFSHYVILLPVLSVWACRYSKKLKNRLFLMLVVSILSWLSTSFKNVNTSSGCWR